MTTVKISQHPTEHIRSYKIFTTTIISDYRLQNLSVMTCYRQNYHMYMIEYDKVINIKNVYLTDI